MKGRKRQSSPRRSSADPRSPMTSGPRASRGPRWACGPKIPSCLTWAEMGLWSENPVRIRFTNTEKRPYRKVEAHLAYKIANPTPPTVTFAWRNSNGPLQTATHVYAPNAADDATWAFDVGANPKTLWVEYSAK